MRTVYVVDGARTPFIKADTSNTFSASDLAVTVGRQILLRQKIEPSQIDEVVVGCVMPSPDEANIARLISLRLGCGDSVPAQTVQRNCASGMQALDTAVRNIQAGHGDLILAGGTEAMSKAPLQFQHSFSHWMSLLQRAKSLPAKLKAFSKLSLKDLKPVITLLKGLTDTTTGMSMGQTAEKLAFMYGISKNDIDAYAVQSHNKAIHAQQEGYFDEEIVPLFAKTGKVCKSDNGVREGSSVEKLQKLKPIFDKGFGLVTAGNSSQVSDGACFLLLASEEAVAKYGLPVLGKIHEAQWVGVDPSIMGIGPAYAIAETLKQKDLNTGVDYYEINEAFAAQVLACTKEMGLEREQHTPCPSNVNVDGGGVSIGHPVGASGARIVLHLLHLLKRKKSYKGIASLCIGGGQGGSMLVEVENE